MRQVGGKPTHRRIHPLQCQRCNCSRGEGNIWWRALIDQSVGTHRVDGRNIGPGSPEGMWMILGGGLIYGGVRGQM